MKERKAANITIFIIMAIVSIAFIMPVIIVAINSFKGQFFISSSPFSLPNTETFAGIQNYVNGIVRIDFFMAFAYSLFITVFSTAAILLFTSMSAWYIVRAKRGITNALYYLYVFSIIVPFQMVMFTMSKVANILGLENPIGIILIYLGFGAGLSVMLFSGFIRGMPIAIEEAAEIDGCNPIGIFFKVILPILKPTAISVAVLNVMWIWNDYLLPYLVIGSKYKTIPVAVQYLQGGYGSRDMGALMAMLVLAIIPIILFYAFSQKYIIKGVVAGAVKG
ncbi:MAG: carbohydrate ABC transporter permease [Ruminococcaceae bacterium]|nr:carbohydrate ABC transporter permease [Oscillospiraceae bacterium]